MLDSALFILSQTEVFDILQIVPTVSRVVGVSAFIGDRHGGAWEPDNRGRGRARRDTTTTDASNEAQRESPGHAPIVRECRCKADKEGHNPRTAWTIDRRRG
ncbi:hypothetical protein E5D57_003549 [Metarhizium anisopliae]|nr:hypothetical protein E5D57_003549 [Metarhizium anisopliae]